VTLTLQQGHQSTLYFQAQVTTQLLSKFEPDISNGLGEKIKSLFWAFFQSDPVTLALE